MIDELDAERPDDVVTVVIPEFVVDHWWDQALHNQSALLIKAKLRQRPNTAILSVPVQVTGTGRHEPAQVTGMGREEPAQVTGTGRDEPVPATGSREHEGQGERR